MGGGRHYAVSKQAQLVSSIVTGDEQLGMVHPIGRPISVSTQRGFSLPVLFRSIIGVSSEYSRSELPRPDLLSRAVGVGHVTLVCAVRVSATPRACRMPEDSESSALGVAHAFT